LVAQILAAVGHYPGPRHIKSEKIGDGEVFSKWFFSG
jgi:hypothetical protein